MHLADLLYSLAGLLVGFLVGLTGVGGGSLMTPLLVLAFGFHPVTAVGTDLLYASATKTVGTIVHGRRGTVDWTIVRRLAAGSLPASLLALIVLARAGTAGAAAQHVLSAVLGGTLITTAVAILFRDRIVARYARLFEDASNRRTAGWTVALGAALGLLVCLSSVGAGALGMTVLLILYPRLPTNRLVGSDIAHAVPLTLLAGIGHWLLGSVNFFLLGLLLIGSVPGIVIGSTLATRAPDRLLRPMLAGTLAIVGGRMLF